MAKVTDLNYALENRLIKRLDKFVDMVQRKKCVQDVLFCIGGLTGAGKTNSALVMAYYLKWVTGRDIHLFFSTEKAANFLKETREKIIIIDEPSLDSLSKDQATRISKNFSRLMNTMRQKRHIVMVCVTRFWRFPIDLIVDRSLAMINMSNKGGKGIGRFQYIRQKNLETLWDNYMKYRKKDFAKLKSFGGAMPERMEKINPSTSKPFFNSMGVIINQKLNCTYKDYKFFRDNEVKDIGVEKKSIKESKAEKELAKVRYVLADYAAKYKIPSVEIAERLGTRRQCIPNWRRNDGKDEIKPIPVENFNF